MMMSKNVKKMEGGDYLVSHTHYVSWTGEPHESWCAIANQLTMDEALAVLCAAQARPQPHGDGHATLADAMKDASFAWGTNCGRQMTLAECANSGPMTRGQQLACDILLEAKRIASKHHVSTIGILRLLCSIRSHGQQNGPHDSYMRLCHGSLKSY